MVNAEACPGLDPGLDDDLLAALLGAVFVAMIGPKIPRLAASLRPGPGRKDGTVYARFLRAPGRWLLSKESGSRASTLNISITGPRIRPMSKRMGPS